MTDGASPQYPPPGAPPPPDPASGGFPPPGAPPPPPPPPPWATYPAGAPHAPVPPPGLMLGAAHKPGALPLRPLSLGHIYDGAFRIIRFNPQATVGAAVLVTAAAMLVPIVVAAVLTFTVGIATDSTGELSDDATVADVVGLLAAYGSLLVSLLLAQVGVVFVTGMIAHVTRAAAVGRRLSLREAWAATHGKRWRLLGLAFLVNLGVTVMFGGYVLLWVAVVLLTQETAALVTWGLVSVPVFLALLVWLWIRLCYLPVPPLMLEPVGVFGALGRGWTLTARQFWRTFGIALLTFVIATFAGSLLSTPVSLLGNVAALAVPSYGVLLLIVTQALSLLVNNAFVAPFQATVASIQYVDLRMRKEAFDVELMREAGIVPA